MINHTDMKKVVKELELVTPFDYLRSVNKYGWTDFNLGAAGKILDQKNSKYIITSSYKLSEDTDANILYAPSLKETLDEFHDRFLKRGDVEGFDAERQRVFGHFVDQNVIIFGNKTGIFYNLELKQAKLEDLTHKEEYSIEMSHTEIEWQLIVLGLSFGFEVKVARNDKSKEFNGYKLSEIATLTINDLPLPELIHKFYKETKKKIDLIDIIWIDKTTRRIIVAFEVELSKNITLAVKRLIELKYAYKNKFNSVIVGKENDLNLTARVCSLLGMQNDISMINLQYLTIENLIEALKHKKKFGSVDSGIKDLFFNILLKDVKSHGQPFLQ